MPVGGKRHRLIQIKENPTFATFKNTNLLSNPMGNKMIGQPFTILESVDSSNNYAMGRVHARMATHGEVFLALEQTAGKGQMGRRWLSHPGENIMMSLVLDSSTLPPAGVFSLSMAMALGCYDWLS